MAGAAQNRERATPTVTLTLVNIHALAVRWIVHTYKPATPEPSP